MRGKSAKLLVTLSACALAEAAAAQCSYQMDLVSAFEAIGQPVVGEQQLPGNGWRFMRSTNALSAPTPLSGVLIANFGAWGDPTQPFSVPLVGPIYSPNASRNQIPFYRRTPSFEGLMCHPGYSDISSEVFLVPQASLTMTSVRVRGELLGWASPNAIIGASIVNSGGVNTTVFTDRSILSLAPAIDLGSSDLQIGMPYPINAGDKLRLRVTNGGDPSEDWVNATISVTVEGAPTIIAMPRNVTIGGPTSGTFRVRAAGSTGYRWYRYGEALSDGPTSTGAVLSGTHSAELTITNAFFDDAGDGYRCVVSNNCGSVTSTNAALSICPSDFDGNGFITFDDFDAFVSAFEGGDATSDFNHDGFLTFEDFDAFVSAFESGC